MSKRAFERVVVIIFENEFRGYVMRNPYMRALAARGIELANYFGVMHPSNTNYVASIAGEICNVTSDPQYYSFLMPPGMSQPVVPDPLPQKTLPDALAAKGLDWRAYMESYSTVDYPPSLQPITDSSGTIDVEASVRQTILDYPPFLNMHNAFVSFSSIMQDEKQWKRIRSSYDFLRDALDDKLPEYSWFTPDIWNIGHWMYGTYQEPTQRAPFLVDQLAKWLESFFGVLRFPGKHSRLPKGTLVAVTFDEADYNSSYESVRGWDGSYDGPNQIYTVLLGDRIEPRRIEHEGYNHYSLLKTVEKNFDLPSLGKNDADANWFRFLWGKSFQWKKPHGTPVESATMAAAASPDGDALHVVYGSGGALSHRTHAKKWSDEQAVPGLDNVSAVAMAAANGTLTLVAQSAGTLYATSFSDGAWSAPQQVAAGAGAFSLASFHDYGDGNDKVMLAWSSGGALQTQVFAGGAWGSPVSVGQQSSGAIALASLGASLFLICQGDGNVMNVVSYNTAPFNIVTTKTGDSNTTQYAWSPSAFPVQHFAAGPKRAPGTDSSLAPYTGAAPFAAATLDGVIHFAHAAPDRSALQTATFSLSGVLTPLNPVDYKESATGVSNGYGTLAEAGWSRQTPLPGTAGAGGALAMAAAGDTIYLLSQTSNGAPLQLSVGSYRR